MHSKNKILFLLLYWISAIAILFFSLRPTGETMRSVLQKEAFIRADYLLHILSFMALTAVAIFSSTGKNQRKLRWILISITIALAIGTEFLQMLIPSRAYNPLDILSNLAGIALALAAIPLIKWLKP